MAIFDIDKFQEHFTDNVALEIVGTDILSADTDEYENVFDSIFDDTLYFEVLNDYDKCLGVISWANCDNVKGDASSLAQKILTDWADENRMRLNLIIGDKTDKLEMDEHDIDYDFSEYDDMYFDDEDESALDESALLDEFEDYYE